MYLQFLSHQFKEFWRGRNRAGGIAAKIIMIFAITYFLLIALVVGVFMEQILKRAFPGDEPVTVFYSFILYYFVVDFLARLQLQELPTLSIQPYLALNISRKKIIGFLNVRSLFNFFNIAPFLILLPYCFMGILPVFGVMTFAGMVVSIFSLVAVNHFLSMWLKRKAGSNAWFIIAGTLIVLLLAALEVFHVISLRYISGIIFGFVARYPYAALLFVCAAITVFLMNSRYLTRNLYLEELTPQKKVKVTTDYPFLNRFGRTGQLAAAELKLILRHKRSKGSLTMSFIFVFYGLFFYKQNLLETNSFASMMFAAVFMTGIFQIAYGQFMFAWQSNHFDGLMANKMDYTDFIKAKFLLFTLAATAVTMLSLLYGLMSWKLIILHLAVYLYNIGFGSVIVLFFANYNRKRLDLSKGATFNWQGVGATQWLLGFPLLLMPFLIYLPFGVTDRPFWGLIAIGLFGIITLAMRDFWVTWLTRLFIKERYRLAEGFRE